MEITEKEKKYRKIALRFLKETGLLNEWKQYLAQKNTTLRNGYTINNWFIHNYIDNIFGCSNFTAYLEENRKVILHNERVVNIFRSYLREFYKDMETNYNKRALPDTISINKEANRTKIIYNK